MRTGKLAAVIGVTACALGAGAATVSAATPQGGKIGVFVTPTTGTKGTILITGAIADYGTTVSQDANGKVDPNGAFEKVTLKQGGFIVNGTALNKRLDHAKPTINQTNCSLSFTGTGPVTIGDGTGAYAGITGKAVLSVTFGGIFPKTVKGCNFNGNPGKANYQGIAGTGTVSFG